jgi:hypothetical protein
MKINYWAIDVAAVAAFVFSSLYYSPLLLGNVWQAVDTTAVAGSKPSIAKLSSSFLEPWSSRLCSRVSWQ